MEAKVALYLFAKRRENRRKHLMHRRIFLERIEEERRRYLKRRTSAFFIALLLVASLNSRGLYVERKLWAKTRSDHWWESVAKTFSDRDWSENFRLSRETFNFLCAKLQNSLKKKDTVMRKAIPVEKRLGIGLWFLARGSDFNTIGQLFGVSKAAVCITVKEVCSALVQLLPSIINIPSGAALKDVIKGFDDLGFPSCAGAVDGTHIPIISPCECPADYYNRKGWHSVIMQGVVDHKGRFMDIYIGWPGRVHDARVFSNSSIFAK